MRFQSAADRPHHSFPPRQPLTPASRRVAAGPSHQLPDASAPHSPLATRPSRRRCGAALDEAHRCRSALSPRWCAGGPNDPSASGRARGVCGGQFSVRSRDGADDPFLSLAHLARCSLDPIFDDKTENAGLTSSKVIFGELRRLEFGPKMPGCFPWAEF